MKKTVSLILAFFILISFSFASVDTVSIYSNAMHKNIKAVVIKPYNYKTGKDFAVVYLLHGAYGNYQNWIRKVPALQTYVDLYKIIIVCPDGLNSWYFDSPIDSSYKFETHVGTEVPAYIDANYKTKKDRKYRAIAGLSMGGHGALFIAFRHAETFGACGSMIFARVVANFLHFSHIFLFDSINRDCGALFPIIFSFLLVKKLRQPDCILRSLVPNQIGRAHV